MKLFRKKGFTLIELLVVVGIIMVLAALVIVSVGNARAKSRDGKRVADLATIQLALEMYKDSNGSYQQINQNWNPVSALSGSLAPYLSPIPQDPINTGNYGYKVFGNYSPGPTTSYWLMALLENDENIPAGFELGKKCYQIWGGAATAGKTIDTDTSYCN